MGLRNIGHGARQMFWFDVDPIHLVGIRLECLHIRTNTTAIDQNLVRNVVDRVAAFREQARVTKPGGRVVCLEITPPSNTILGPLFQLYFFAVVPLLGTLISGDTGAYKYLPQSTVNFPAPSELKLYMETAGLQHVFFVERMLGTVALHVGTK